MKTFRPRGELTQEEMNQTQESNLLLAKHACKFAIPLYQLSNGTPDLVGSGFILNIYGRSFLVTAAHVFDNNSRQNPIFFYTGISEVQFVRGFYRETECVDRTEDKIDIAVMMLSENVKFHIDYETIDESVIYRNTTTLSDGRLFFAGYPLSRHSIDKKTHTVDFTCYAWSGRFVPNEKYQRVGASKENNLLISFINKHALNLEGTAGVQFPRPDGVSGGPVWVALGERNARRQLIIEEFRLVGVLIEYHPQERVMLATSIDRVMDFIDGLYADFGNVIES